MNYAEKRFAQTIRKRSIAPLRVELKRSGLETARNIERNVTSYLQKDQMKSGHVHALFVVRPLSQIRRIGSTAQKSVAREQTTKSKIVLCG